MLIGMSKKMSRECQEWFRKTRFGCYPDSSIFLFSLSLSLSPSPCLCFSFSPSLSYANHQDDQPTLHIIIPVRKMGTDGPVGLRMGLRMRMINDIHT